MRRVKPSRSLCSFHTQKPHYIWRWTRQTRVLISAGSLGCQGQRNCSIISHLLDNFWRTTPTPSFVAIMTHPQINSTFPPVSDVIGCSVYQFLSKFTKQTTLANMLSVLMRESGIDTISWFSIIEFWNKLYGKFQYFINHCIITSLVSETRFANGVYCGFCVLSKVKFQNIDVIKERKS